MMPKLETLRKAIDESGKDIILSVDGGIDPATAPIAAKAGARLLVAGSAVFKGDIKENVAAINNALIY
jgi:ribulose-phosphate 3-epimerase